VREFAAWPAAQIEREWANQARVQADGWEAARLALFGLEADLARISLAPTALNRSSRTTVNQFPARKLLSGVAIPAARRNGDKDLQAFARDWYFVAQIVSRGAGPIDLDSPGQLLPDDPIAKLLEGASYAHWMGPRRSGGFLSSTTGVANKWLSWRGEEYDSLRVREAQVAFEDAIELDANLAEAHLRLGRLLQQTGREREAQRELESVSTLPGAVDTRYLAQLFLGQLFEDQGDPVAAIGAYDRALAVYAAGPAARLARGRALLAAGRPGAGWASMRSVFEPEAFVAGPNPAAAARDPWVRYPAAGYMQAGVTLARLRARVSKTPLREQPAAVSAQARFQTADAMTASARPPAPEGVRINALVRSGNDPIEGLTAADFVVSDGFMPARVVSATRTDSLSIAFVVDVSSSVSAETSWAQVKDATARAAHALSPKDLASFVVVTERPNLRADLVRPDALLAGPIAALAPRPDQRTALWDSVAAAASLVADGPGRPVVLVISDGFDNSSWLERRRAFKLLDTLGVVVDSITVPYQTGGLADIAEGEISSYDLERVTPGVAFLGGDKSLSTKLAARFDELRASYTVRFIPNEPAAGQTGWQDSKLRLRPGLSGKVEARAGYFVRIDR